MDDLSTTVKPKECIMKFDSRSAETLGQVDLLVNNAGIQHVTPLAPWQKDRATARRAAAMLAFATGLLVAALGAPVAGELTWPQPTADRAGEDKVRLQPTTKQFPPSNQPDVSDNDSRYVDELYRQLIGPTPETSSDSRSSTGLRAAPSDNAAGSVRRWTSPR
jgi:NAD(P)-dependent dehydrogenase (short-subunit alcohol dehydrogenase family)